MDMESLKWILPQAFMALGGFWILRARVDVLEERIKTLTEAVKDLKNDVHIVRTEKC